MGETFAYERFQRLPPRPVNHSIVDAAALLIDTPVGRIVHTGDFKLDATPFFGQRFDESVFEKAGEEGVLLLMSDSTNVERHYAFSFRSRSLRIVR